MKKLEKTDELLIIQKLYDYLMKGMRGDADENNDNQITVGELGNYVKENVSDMAGMLDREQTPGLQTLDEEKVLIRY